MSANGQNRVTAETLASVSTPDRIESRLGTLEFNDGAPSDETAALVYDNLDFQNGVQAFLGSIPGVSIAAVRQGFLAAGIEDNSFMLFSELMDSASLFLTGNCDTVYFWGFVDLSDGPMVLDVPALGAPSGILGVIDDMWFRWVTDIGLPGPDRSEGGKYLLVGPGYDGPLPDSGFHVSHVRTTRVTLIGRAFMVDNDPTTPVKAIREGFRVSPYVPGAEGTAVASYLAGDAVLGAAKEVPKTDFVEMSGVSCNTLFPGDFGFWEVINELVQQEPPEAGDPELLGLLASIGIVHGKPFEPDARMRKILEDAAVVGNATARTVTFAARPEESFEFYPGSQWQSALFVGGYQFMDPPPKITAEGAAPMGPSDGARKLDSRTNFFYMATEHPGDVHAPHRNWLAVHLRDARRRRRLPRRRPQLQDDPASQHPPVPLLVVDHPRPPDALHAPDRPAPPAPGEPVRHRRGQLGRDNRPLLRTHRTRRQGEQLAPNRPRQGLVADPPAL